MTEPRWTSWISVKVHDEVIEDVVYYYAKVKGANIVKHILFRTASSNIPLLKTQLAEKFGEKVQKGRGRDWYLLNLLGHDLEIGEPYGSGNYSVTRHVE